MSDDNPVLAAALAWAARGWRLFPCDPRAEKPHAKSPLVTADLGPDGKSIAGTGWPAKASDDASVIRNWWAKWPDAMIGAAPGWAGAFVVDLDPKGEPVEAVEARLVEAVGPLPETARTITQSGGRHLWFAQPEGEWGNATPGLKNIDIRCDAGYVILPPSRLRNGNRYAWEGAPFDPATAPPVPVRLLEAIRARKTHAVDGGAATGLAEASATRSRGEGAGARARRRYATAALDDIAAEAATAAPGGRGTALFSGACSAGRLVAAGDISEREALAALLDAASASGLIGTDGAARVEREIKRGLSAGRADAGAVVERLATIGSEAEARAGWSRGGAAARVAEMPDDGRWAPPASLDDYGASGARGAVPAAAGEDGDGEDFGDPGEGVFVPPPPTPPGGDDGGASADGSPPGDRGFDHVAVYRLLLRCAAEPQNDIGNSRRFRHRYGHQVLHVQNIGWHVWDGRRWAEDVDARLSRPMAHRTVEAIAYEALVIRPTAAEQVAIDRGLEAEADLAALPAKDAGRGRLEDLIAAGAEAREAVADRKVGRRRFATTAGNKGKLDGMLSELLAYVSLPIGDLDTDPYALNTMTGTLRFIGEVDPECPDPAVERITWRVALFPHERMDRISKLCEVEYDPEATAPVFDAFLARILPQAEVRAYVRRYFGYGLLGTSREQVFAMFHGEGANGKSTLVDIVARIMGGYSTSLPIATLIGDTTKKGSEATPDLARLPGARLVRTAEPKEGLPLNEDVIKTLTSSEAVPIRRLHQEFVDVYPVFSLVISANRKPDIRGDNDGIWRRVALVPFDVQIPLEERDKQLPEKLWVERSGILNWLVAGALDYLAQGLAPPPTVRAATDEYRAENDLMGAFIAGALDVTRNPVDEASPGHLYAAFGAYCAQQAHTVWREQTFSKRFAKAAERAGIEKAKASVVIYRGVRIRAAYSGPPPSRTHGHD